MAKKNLIKLAKSSKNKKPVPRKLDVGKVVIENKPVVKKLTTQEERDIKAKETVEKLLEDSPIITLDKKEVIGDVNESEQEPETPKGVEWLEEQVTLLSSELAIVNSDYEKLLNEYHQNSGGAVASDGSQVSAGVIQLFEEIQENHIKLGVNEDGVGNFRIYCPGFLNRMVKFFPFLDDYKRY